MYFSVLLHKLTYGQHSGLSSPKLKKKLLTQRTIEKLLQKFNLYSIFYCLKSGPHFSDVYQLAKFLRAFRVLYREKVSREKKPVENLLLRDPIFSTTT